MTWNPDAEDLTDKGEGEAGQKLFALLQEALDVKFERYASLRHARQDPVLLGRWMVPSRWQGQRPEEQLQFQFGPRRWLAYGAFLDERFSPHENMFYAAAKVLQDGDWVSLAEELLDETLARQQREEARKTAILLVRQGEEKLLVIHDQRGDDAVVYALEEDRLRILGKPHPVTFRNLPRAPRKPVVSLAEGMRDPKPGEKVGQIEELKDELLWRYGTKLDGSINTLLFEAGEKISSLGEEVALAYSPFRFNDASNDNGWTAIRVDNFAWENGAYFSNNATTLARAPGAVHEALGLLHHLLACGLVVKFSQAYGQKVEGSNVMGLFVQEGRCYIATSDSNGGDGPVYEIDRRTGGTQLVGFAPRFDWNFNKGSMPSGRCIPEEHCLQWMPIGEWLDRVNRDDIDYVNMPYDLDVPWTLYAPQEEEEDET